ERRSRVEKLVEASAWLRRVSRSQALFQQPPGCHLAPYTFRAIQTISNQAEGAVSPPSIKVFPAWSDKVVPPMAYVLWTRFLRHNRINPQWSNRDRFFRSCARARRSAWMFVV